MLSDELWTFSDIVEQLTARSRLRNSPGALQVARLLYYDPLSGKPKRAARLGDGGYRRFCQFLQNLPSTFNLSTMSAETIMALLPNAFDQWIYDSGVRSENAEIRSLFGFDQSVRGAIPNVAHLADALINVGDRPVSSSKVKVRSDTFRIGVLEAYSARCCISNIGLVHTTNENTAMYEVQAAHIIPVSEHGSDVIPNGLALNRTLHWAFDLGMVWIDSEMRVNIAAQVENDRRNEWLRSFKGTYLRLPNDPHLRPSHEALSWHAEHVAFR